ncbi:MAG: XRE family transcriptional regulator [Sphaerochaetaceae bacterium]
MRENTVEDAGAALDAFKSASSVLRKSVSEEINKTMKERGISKADLARLLGTSRSNITQILKGDRNFTIDTLCSVADGLGMRVDITLKKRRKQSRAAETD